MASAVFITDLSGKMIISRNYRGDVPMNKALERFSKYLMDTPEEQKKPIFYADVNGDYLHQDDVGCTGNTGETFVYVNVRTSLKLEYSIQASCLLAWLDRSFVNLTCSPRCSTQISI